jgi:hypothetical protein
MSADLLITALVVDEDRELDFEAADRAIGALGSDDVIESDFFDDHDPDEPEGLAEIRSALHADLSELREAIEHGVQIVELRFRGAAVYVTGGMSYGDGPTEVWDVIFRLRAVRGVLAAIGFEEKS